jgi:Caspase domain
MTNRVLSRIAFLCGIMLVLLSTHAAWAERRVALVVGNSQYKNTSLALFNPKNDAEDIAAALRSLDFEVILTVDAGKREFDIAMTQFARLATNADAALFFYAGHALQYQGRNYLVPVDGELEDEISLRYQMISLDDIRAAVERADGVKIIILDACRNNPIVDNLRRKMVGASRSIGTTRGLARIDKALGMVVAYATAADEVAADGSGRNSPFSRALLKRLQEPGLEIGTMFRRVAADVNEQTNGRQRPETYVSLIGEYYLNQKDRPVWALVKDSADPAAFRNFIARFPSSPRVSDAQYRLEMLERLAREGRFQPASTESDAGRAKLAAEQEQMERARLAQQAAKAAAEQQKQAALTPEPPPTIRPQIPPATIPQAEACKRDEARLIHLRANPDRDEVIRFERELACIKLRSQVLRLKESVLASAPAAGSETLPPSKPEQLPPKAGPQQIPQPQPVTTPGSQDEACKRDEATLARLRASRDRDQVIRFERELSCTRLRSQVVRLRESVGAD